MPCLLSGVLLLLLNPDAMRRLFLFLTVLFASAHLLAASNPLNANCIAVSPSDSSVWYGIKGGQLHRLGRNGRELTYPVYNIKNLAFDASGVLWILDGEGLLSTYSPVSGIQSNSAFQQPLGAFLLSSDHQKLYAEGSDGKIYVMDVTSRAPVLLGEAIYDEPLAPEAESGHSSWWWLIAIAALLAGFAAGFSVSRKCKAQYIVTETVTSAVQSNSDALSNEDGSGVLPDESEESDLPETAVEPCLDGPFARSVLDLIRKNLSNHDFGVEEIANELGMSRIHVNRKLKAEAGVSPSAIIKDERMKLAMELLLDGSVAIADISQKCGFKTPSYFSTAFKDYYGKTPSDIRP